MTRPDILEKNYPGLLKELETASPDEWKKHELETEVTPAGFPSMKVRGLYIHSPRDPVREARRQVESAASAEKGRGPIVILGFGLGYAAEAVAEVMPGRPLIIVERRREIARTALKTRDLGQLLFNNKVVFVLGEQGAIAEALNLFDKNEKPLLIRNQALVKLDKDWYTKTEQDLQTWVSRSDINRATLKRFGRRWVRNLSQNIAFVRDLPGIGLLKNTLKNTGFPVFLAAAGPSLDKTAPIMREIRRRCVVIAVDTSLRFILGAGVEPDFVVSLDPQYWNYRHLDRTFAPGTCLVAESAVYPACLRHRFRMTFLAGSLFPLGRFIEDRVDSKGELGAGGSVATAAWDFARILGTGAVWISGLDLSFPGLKTHFRGALFEEKSHANSFRFSPGETWSVKALRDGSPFYAKNALGGRVLTDKRLSLYASWFVNRFAIFPEIHNYCLGGEGIAIKGMEIKDEKDLLALPECRKAIDRVLETAFFRIKNEFFQEEAIRFRTEKYEMALKALVTGLEKVQKTASGAAEFAEAWISRLRIGHTTPGDEKNILKRLDEATRTISTSEVRDVAGFLFPDPDDLESNAGIKPVNPLLAHLEYSNRFYQALTEAAAYNLNILSR